MSGVWLDSVAVVVALVLPFSVAGAVKAPKDRKAAPTFTLKDSTGAELRLSDYRGKVVLLNFWATWCGPCKIEIPWFIEFDRTYKDRGFEVIGVSMDEDGWNPVKPYIAAHKINYHVVMGNDQVAASYDGVESLPTTFLIDRDGRIASVHSGLVSRAEYEKDIQQVLGSAKSGKN
jgi:peroxiredoxin